MKWFEAAVKAKDAVTDKLEVQKYLIDAITFAEAEHRVIEYLIGERRKVADADNKAAADTLIDLDGGECVTLKKVNISEVTDGENKEYWYKVKVMFISFDEKTGKEKLSPSNMMVAANSVAEAVKITENSMKGTMSDWRMVAVTETDILDLIRYDNTI